MKSVLISIRPKWCELIASGKKTVEVRKTRPKLDLPFKCYIYCTKGKGDCLWRWNGIWYDAQDPTHRPNRMDGKVIGEFVCDRIITAPQGKYCLIPTAASQIDALDLMDYAEGKTVYGWHISDLVIYDKPRELSEFYQKCKSYDKDEWESDDCLECENPCGNGGKLYLKRAPQSWCYVEGREEMQNELKQIADDGERKGFFEAVREAYEFAVQEGIRANTLLIDKNFAKVSGVHIMLRNDAFGMEGVSLPPMILGLEARIAPLPAGFGFAVTEVVQTERDKLYAEAKAAGRREVIEQLKEFLFEREDEDGN